MGKKRYLKDGVVHMDLVRQVLRLSEEGISQRQIHRSLGIARSTLQRYLRLARQAGLTYQESKSLTDSELKERLDRTKPGRTKMAVPDPDFELIHRELKSRKGITRELLWEEWVACSDQYYSYGTFCRRFREWLRSSKVWMRQDYPGGEKCLVDFSGETLCYYPKPGDMRKAEIFVGVLGASNYIFCTAKESQSLLYWQQSNIEMLEYFGGVPKAVVVDNLKSAVTSADRYEPIINKVFQEVSDYYGTTVLPTRVGAPQDKAKVEQSVQMVQRHILAKLRKQKFVSVAAINCAIKPLLEQLNQRVMRDYGVSRRALFLERDMPLLQPLPSVRYVPQQWQAARVSMDYHIQFEHHYYSVPYHLARQEVWIRATSKMVEIFHDNTRVASHIRSATKYEHTTNPQHMPANHRFQKSRTKPRFQKWAREVGPETAVLTDRLLNLGKHPEQGFRSILGLQRLEKKHGSKLLEHACGVANSAKIVSQRYVRKVLDEIEKKKKESAAPTIHTNIRGSEYYH